MTICEKCGRELVIGDFPFCPHPLGRTSIYRDEIPGGIVLENYGPQPVRFDSHSERRRYMKEHGLQEREKFSPLPGTDKDPAGIPNPRGYMDAQTLENAKTLLLRAQKAEPEWDGQQAGVLRLLPTQVMTEEEARDAGFMDAERRD